LDVHLKEAGDIAGLAQAKTSWRRLPKISNRITETRKLIHLLEDCLRPCNVGALQLGAGNEAKPSANAYHLLQAGPSFEDL